MDILTEPEQLVEYDCMLSVTRTDGELRVYRSPLIGDDDDWYQQALEIVGDAALISRETVTDAGMMLGQAELSIYRVAV